MWPSHTRKRLGASWSPFSPLWFLAVFTFSFVLLGSPQHSYGVIDVTLSWGANSEEDLAGYRVFNRQDGQSYDYNNPVWEGWINADEPWKEPVDPDHPTCTIYDLDDASTHYFVVRAFDASDNESGDSNEVSYQGVPPGAVLESLSVTGTDSVAEGTAASYTATALFSDGSSQIVTESASWSEDSSYATINSTGVLSTLQVTSDQDVTITATYTHGGLTETAQWVVTIVDVPSILTGLSVNGSSAVNENASSSYTATALFSDGSSQIVTESASWSEDSSYATINSTGVLSTLEVTSDQDVTITATYTHGGVTETAQWVVTIVDVPESNLAPWQPVITSPYDGQMDCELQTLVVTEPFSDPDGDPHSQSRWQISSEELFDSAILDVTSSDKLTQLTVPHMVLEADTTYYVRVRFYDVYLEDSEWSEAIEFTTSGDVADAPEVGDDVDLNGDGIADNDQPDLIKCAQSADGSGTIGVCKVSDSIEAIEAVETIDPATLSDTPVDFLLGLFSYRIRVNEVGTTATVRIYFSEDISETTTFYKYDTIGGWQDYAQHTTFNDDGRSITLELKDGGYGDSDRTANGVIVDPGGLAAATSVDIGAIADSASESSSGGGGCFIETVTRDSGSYAEPFNLCTSCTPAVRLIIAPLVDINYVLVNAFGPTGTAAGLLLAGFVLGCLLRMRGRFLSQGVRKNQPLKRHQAQA